MKKNSSFGTVVKRMVQMVLENYYTRTGSFCDLETLKAWIKLDAAVYLRFSVYALQAGRPAH